MIQKFTISLLLVVFAVTLRAQNDVPDTMHILGSAVIDGDTLPNHPIKEVMVFPKRVFKNKRQQRRYTRLIKNVKKAYPFALVVRKEFGIMDDSLQYIKSERERKKFIKEYEKQMFMRYEEGLRKLTFSQGRILLKLVYRELGNTSYYYVKEYRGDFSALFWQGIARIFGANLKSTYEPDSEDAEIEIIVQMIEAGVI
ncbi:MAG: DUF4294 domain-containing protein [Salinivirgaceae bacterium]|jgi:hypothetical protein|nr:DUF4294 domain-containing protein [Salinivirgaceae bacterium]